jgi:hypothetical protein
MQAGLLHPIDAKPIKLQTSMYTDDTALFLRPIAADVNICNNFFSRLDRHHDYAPTFLSLRSFPADVRQLTCPWSLGNFRPPSLGSMQISRTASQIRPAKEDEQALINKVVSGLPNWKGRLLNRAGHLVLVNSVLSSLVLHHMTVFQLSKWALKRIDRIRRRFLWHGADSAWSGHCLVHWKRVTQPKRIGGLGILDLARFNKALRLHWPWLL